MRIQEVDVQHESERMINFLSEHLAAHATGEYFRWLYRGNPFGTAKAWLLEDDNGGVVGAAAAFPRSVRVRGDELTAWNLGDFAIQRNHRSLGPALKLQRACLDEVLQGRVPFAYDHPSCNMMAIYKRIGVENVGRVVRFAKPLRVDPKVERFIRSPSVARGVSGLGNLVLSMRNRPGVGSRAHPARFLRGRFDERVTDLDRRMAGQFQVMGVRTAEYLNWRFVDHPLRNFEVLYVEEPPRWLGYAVYYRSDDHAYLVDLIAEDGAVADGLLASVTAAATQAGAHTLSAPVLEPSPLASMLAERGFSARESAPFVVSTQPGASWDGIVTELSNWYHSDGDRDG